MNRRLAQGYEPDAAAGLPAVVALGANLGDRAATLAAAVADLRALPLVWHVRVAEPIASVAITPHGPDPDAPGYLNSVAVLRTRLAPTVLLAELHRIEAHHGRVRRERWGDRTLDLDLISVDDLRCDTAGLTLPHPRAAERDFVLAPWLALDPAAVLPGHGAVADLLARLRQGDAP